MSTGAPDGADTDRNGGFLAFLGCGKCHSENPLSGACSNHKLRMVLSSELKEITMARKKSHKDHFSSDRSFPYVLLCSTLGTVVSLASVWLATAQTVAQAMVA